MSDADFIVVGSGPAGVSAALALTEAGRSVLMLDGGEDDAGDPSRLGSELESLRLEDGLSPKLRTPEARGLLSRFGDANRVSGENFVVAGALGRGGLSRIWGGFVSEFDAGDMRDWPIGASALAPSYARVAARMGVSGSGSDAMSALLGQNGPLQPPLPLGAACALLLLRRHARDASARFLPRPCPQCPAQPAAGQPRCLRPARRLPVGLPGRSHL